MNINDNATTETDKVSLLTWVKVSVKLVSQKGKTRVGDGHVVASTSHTHCKMQLMHRQKQSGKLAFIANC